MRTLLSFARQPMHRLMDWVSNWLREALIEQLWKPAAWWYEIDWWSHWARELLIEASQMRLIRPAIDGRLDWGIEQWGMPALMLARMQLIDESLSDWSSNSSFRRSSSRPSGRYRRIASSSWCRWKAVDSVDYAAVGRRSAFLRFSACIGLEQKPLSSR